MTGFLSTELSAHHVICSFLFFFYDITTSCNERKYKMIYQSFPTSETLLKYLVRVMDIFKIIFINVFQRLRLTKVVFPALQNAVNAMEPFSKERTLKMIVHRCLGVLVGSLT